MASIPMDQFGKGRSGGRIADRPPVSTHPAFPAIVALWFAALLGLGSLILPVQLLERLLTATGIASLIPSAAPPLGFTARAAIALMATVGGALLGLFAARKIMHAATRTSSTVRELPANYAVEDFNDDGLDADLPPLREAATIGGRRRPLALAEEKGPSDFLNVVPLPGDYAKADDDALELGLEFAPVMDEHEVTDDLIHPEPSQDWQEFIPAEAEVVSPEPEPPVAFTRRQPAAATAVEPLHFAPPSLARFTGYAPEPATAPADDATATKTSELDTHSADLPAPEATPEIDVDIARHEQVFARETQPAASPGAGTGADDGSDGLVQLVQKLGHTLEKHREWAAQRAAAASVAASQSRSAPHAEFAEEFEPAPADDAAEAMAAWFGNSAAAADAQPQAAIIPQAAPAVPQAYAPFANMGRLTMVDDAADDEDEDDDIEQLAASFRLPVDKQDSVAPLPRDASYSSLTAANPFRRTQEEFVRIQEPEAELGLARPAVVFPSEEVSRPRVPAANTRPQNRPFDPPGTAPAPVAQLHSQAQSAPAASRPASNDDSERALREALMNLQRMGK